MSLPQTYSEISSKSQTVCLSAATNRKWICACLLWEKNSTSYRTRHEAFVNQSLSFVHFFWKKKCGSVVKKHSQLITVLYWLYETSCLQFLYYLRKLLAWADGKNYFLFSSPKLHLKKYVAQTSKINSRSKFQKGITSNHAVFRSTSSVF